MKLRIITEMPLAGYHASDTIDKSGRSYDASGREGYWPQQFSSQSRNALRHPKVLQRLTEVLSRTGYNIIIIADAEAPHIQGEKLPVWYYKNAGIDPRAAENAITLLVSMDNSEGQHHLSSWMILHQLGEIVTQGGSEGPWTDAFEKYKKYLSASPLARGREIDVEIYGGESFKDAFTHIFKMQSAQNFSHGASDNFDMDAELVVEYLWHGGKVRVNYPDWIDRKVVDAIKSDIESDLSKRLGSMIGLAYNNDMEEIYAD